MHSPAIAGLRYVNVIFAFAFAVALASAVLRF